MIIEILETFSLILAALMMAYLVRHYIFTLTVLKNVRKRKENADARNPTHQPIVSILIPARNEEKVIGRILQRMTELTYPKHKMEVIVVNDASTDDTEKIAEQYSEAHDYIRTVHRKNEEGGKGKASALNFGLKHVKGDIILCFDADYYPQDNIVEKLTREFAEPKVGIVQGRITVLNEPRNVVTRLVALERIGGYGIDQQARNDLGLIAQFGGTVGGIKRNLLESLGGWDESILAEDTDLTFRAYLAGYKIRYVSDAECYEEAVESWRAYWKQRYRWARGHMQCAFKHSIEVLKNNNLKRREKIDGLLLLSVYFIPVLILLSLIMEVPLLILGSTQVFAIVWAPITVSLYSFVGNFAPFFEVGIGTYLDKRTRAQWLIPLLIFTFLYNIPICTKALLDLLISKILRKKNSRWEKTVHSGNGNNYIRS